MQTISVNGISIQVPDGANVSISNGNVTVNGDMAGRVSIGPGNINISNSNNAHFTLNCDNNVTVAGPVSGGVTAKGNVSCTNISGGVSGVQVKCTNVSGGIEAQGDVQVSGHVSGGIEAKTCNKS
jgi:cytoskeletal protein CcmA (bactofilin family)